MLKGTYFTRLRVDGGEARDLGVEKERAGLVQVQGQSGRPAQKRTGGPFLQGSQGQRKDGEADDTKMIPKQYQNNTKPIPNDTKMKLK